MDIRSFLFTSWHWRGWMCSDGCVAGLYSSVRLALGPFLSASDYEPPTHHSDSFLALAVKNLNLPLDPAPKPETIIVKPVGIPVPPAWRIHFMALVWRPAVLFLNFPPVLAEIKKVNAASWIYLLFLRLIQAEAHHLIAWKMVYHTPGGGTRLWITVWGLDAQHPLWKNTLQGQSHAGSYQDVETSRSLQRNLWISPSIRLILEWQMPSTRLCFENEKEMWTYQTLSWASRL